MADTNDKVETPLDEAQRLQTESSTLVDKALTEKRDLTAEEQTANEQRFSRINTISKLLGERQKFAAIAFAGTDPKPKGTVQRGSGDEPGRGAYEAGRSEAEGEKAEGANILDTEKRAFSAEVTRFAGWGDIGRIADRVNTRGFATITTATGSGILLPKQVLSPIVPLSVNPYRAAHSVYGVKPIETGNTAAMSMPVLDATAGSIVAENASSGTENGGVTESASLTPKTFTSGQCWFSNQMLRANDFDLLQSIVPGLTLNKELALESAISSAIIADSGITQTVVLTTTASSALTYAKLVELANKLPARYGVQNAIVLSADAYNAAISLTGSDGHPILIQDPQNQGLTRFLGIPVFKSTYLEAFGAVTKCVGVIFSLFGLKLRDVTVQELTRYTNQPARPNQTGLELFAYHGYGYAPSAVAKLLTSAT